MKSSLPAEAANGLVHRLSRKIVHWSVRLFAPKWTVGALVVVRDADGRVLLLEHRGRAKPWGLPGGLIGWPEAPAAAAVRECFEELGLTLRVDGLRLLDVLISERLPLMEVVFEHVPAVDPADVRAESLQTSEIRSFRWVGREEIAGMEGVLERHARVLLIRDMTSGPNRGGDLQSTMMDLQNEED